MSFPFPLLSRALRPLNQLRLLQLPRGPLFSSTASQGSAASRLPPSTSRGPPSPESTQTDFSALDMLSSSAPSPLSIAACLPAGFAFASGARCPAACLLLGGEGFEWCPWAVTEGVGKPLPVLDALGRYDPPAAAWGVLDLLWPKPDILILGTGAVLLPLAPRTRSYLAAMGVGVEVLDTRNAAALFNLLGTERGPDQVGAALLPAGWRG
ncbi:MAG: hypothetical protein M1829_003443 [Trizodia sp. TS-e1964]|nr:MAG: hypothetical protein M1829_003443 [Trizodia sp. TS-e1964]